MKLRHWVPRLLRLLTVLLLVGLLPAALAEEDVQITLHWTDETGSRSVTASAVPWGDDTVYWARLDSDEVPDDLTVSYSGAEGYTFSPAEGQPLTGTLTETVIESNAVPILMLDNDGTPVKELKLYLSDSAWPDGVITVHVPVRCELTDGTLLGETTAECMSRMDNTVLAPDLPGVTAVDSTVAVEINDFGQAEPETVVFRYVANSAAPVQVMVPVQCVTEDGTVIFEIKAQCTSASQNVVQAPEVEGYKLLGEESTATVHVRYDGTTDPETVVFTYYDATVTTPAPYGANVTVHYVDESGRDIIAPVTVEVPGNSSLEITPEDAPDGFVAFDAEPVTVTVYDGKIDIDNVTFIYRAEVTETPVPDEATVGRWGCTVKPQVKIRSAASAKSHLVGNPIASGTVFWVVESVLDDSGNPWVHIILQNGSEGYILREYVRIFSQLESDQYTYQNNAAEPGQTEEAAEATPAPQTEGIGYAILNASTCLYGAPGDAFNILSVLDEGTAVWVESEQTLDDVSWYCITANGAKGYIPAGNAELTVNADAEADDTETAPD